MKTATVADLRNRFADVSRHLLAGDSVTITKRGRPFAVLAPARRLKSPPATPLDRLARLKGLFPDGPVPSSTAPGGVLDELRGEQ